MLPALLNDSIVGITIPQMDSLSSFMIDCDAVKEVKEVYKKAVIDAYIEIEKRDTAIAELNVLTAYQSREIDNQDIHTKNLTDGIGYLQKDLKRQKRKTAFAWGTGAIVAGVLTGLFITK